MLTSGKPLLSAPEWKAIARVLPVSTRGGAGRKDDKRVVSTLLLARAVNVSIEQAAGVTGANPGSVRTRLRRWGLDGTMARIEAVAEPAMRRLGKEFWKGWFGCRVAAARRLSVPIWTNAAAEIAARTRVGSPGTSDTSRGLSARWRPQRGHFRGIHDGWWVTGFVTPYLALAAVPIPSRQSRPPHEGGAAMTAPWSILSLNLTARQGARDREHRRNFSPRSSREKQARAAQG